MCSATGPAVREPVYERTLRVRAVAAALNVPHRIFLAGRIKVGAREQADLRRRAADVRKHRHSFLRSLPSDQRG